MNIVYYITGHGYGHAVRSIEIIKKLLDQDHSCTVHIRTKAPQWLFSVLPKERTTYQEVILDYGVLQKNSYKVDKPATLQANLDLIARAPSLVKSERLKLESLKPDIVVSDITPLAFEIAEQLSVPSVAVGNFSWDWIYTPFLDEYPAFEPVIEFIQRHYAKAKHLYRLPFYGDMSAFPNIIDVPLVCRRSDAHAQSIKNRLGIEKEIFLIALRENDLTHVNWNNVSLPEELVGLATFRVPHPQFKQIKEGEYFFQDLVKTAKIALSKPGYGIVSDCIANQTRLLYIPRNDFAEEPVLQSALANFATSERIERQDLKAGHWHALETLMKKPHHWPKMDLSGAEFTAKEIKKSRQ
jgi:L-arabinokinase